MGLATVGTAWCAYQAAWWSSLEATRFAQANAARAESIRASDLADADVEIDVASFVAWLIARGEGNAALAEALEMRFRDEFRVAFEAWRARPAGDRGLGLPPETPFALDAYRLQAQVEAAAKEQKAVAAFQEARRANTISTNYFVPIVLFATVLFLASTAIKLQTRRAHLLLMGLAVLMMLVATVLVFAVPRLA